MKHLMVTPVIGLPQFSGWAQVVVTADHSLIVALAVSGTNARNVGRELADVIRASAITQPDQFYSLLESLQADAERKECQLGLSAGFFQSEIATFGVAQGKVLLKRSDKVGTLLYSSTELRVIQGQLHDQDLLVFFTEQARRFEEEITQKLHQGFDVDTIVTSVVPGLHSSEDSSQSAIGFLQHNLSNAELDDSIATLNSSVLQEDEPEVSNLDEAGFMSDSAADDIEVEFDLTDSNLSQWSDEDDGSVGGEQDDRDELSYEQLQSSSSWQTDRPLFMDELTTDQSDNTDIPTVSDPMLSPSRRQIGLNKLELLTSSVSTVMVAVLAQLQVWWKKMLTGVNAITGRFGGSHKAVYMATSSPRKLVRMVLPALLVVLVVIVLVGAWSWQHQQAVRAAEAVVSPLEAQFIEAKSVVETNPIQARKSIEEVIERLKALGVEFEQEPTTKKLISAKIIEIEAYFQTISGKEEFSVLPTFYNLRLAQEGFIVTTADVSGNQAVFLDGGQQKIVLLNLDSKEQRVIDVAAAGEVFDIAFDGSRVYLLAEQGLFSQRIESTELVKLRDPETALQAARQLDIFGTTIYVVNAGERNVFRFIQSDEGKYEAGTGWMKSAPGLSFDQVTQLQIDGNIWLASKDGSLRQYRTGTAQDFAIAGLSDPLTDSITFFSDEDDLNLYILESVKNRVVVINKNGEFVKEIKSGSLASATVVIANETKNKVYAVSGAEVFEISVE